MKKQLTTILVITFVGLVLVAFTEANIKNLEASRAEKLLSMANTSAFITIYHDSSVIVKKQQTVQPRDKGVGPVKELKLDPINQKMANEGKDMFTAKCSVCHSLDQKIIGPPLRNEIKTRAPEFIMNMILNPTKMEKEDPIIKELHKKYIATPMTDQAFTQGQARILLEYLRTVAK